MTKKELIQILVQETGIRRDQAHHVLDVLAEQLAETLCAGGEAALPGLGKLKVVERAARPGRNPRTGEPIAIPARKAIKFQPSKPLKQAIEEAA